MLSEADLIAKRATLRWLAQRHPSWTRQELATTLRMSRSWVGKWLHRLQQADPGDVMTLHSRSCARHTPPASIASQPAVVQRILEIRVAPEDEPAARSRTRSDPLVCASRPHTPTRWGAPAALSLPRSGSSCAKRAAWKRIVGASPSHWNPASQGRRSNLIGSRC